MPFLVVSSPPRSLATVAVLAALLCVAVSARVLPDPSSQTPTTDGGRDYVASKAAAASSTPSTILLLTRMAGIMTSGPSLLTNTMLLSSAVVAYKGRNSIAQRAMIISTLFAILGDLLVWFNLVSWFTYPGNSPPFFSYVIVTISINKRLYSIVTAYITFLRFQALTGVEKAEVWKWVYVGSYAVVSVTTATLHLLCYTTQNWDRVLFRQTVLYKYIYCPSQFATATVLFGLGLFTDLHFLVRSFKSPVINAKFLLVRAFYNIHIFVLMEIFMYLLFSFLLVWSILNTDVTAAIYVEQFVLALMMLNGAHIVRTVLITDAASYAFSSGMSGQSDKVAYGRESGSRSHGSSSGRGRRVPSPRRLNVDVALESGREV